MTDSARERVGLEAPKSFAAHVENWLNYAAWYRNVKSWWPYRHHEKVLLLRFQDLKRDLAASIDQIATFLNWEITPKCKAAVLEYSSFEWMKAHDDKFSTQIPSREPLFKHGHFIRQGKVGDYKKLITPELEQKILDRAREELEPGCLRFLEIEN
jgi:hypothetical protein